MDLQQTTLRTFSYYDEKSSEEASLVISEVLDASYGLYVWPSAPVLAQYIWYYRGHVENKQVLEIGSGTALPGLLAAKCGGHVTLSDSCQLPRCLENCRASCNVNGLDKVKVIGITWGQISPDLMELEQVDIILGSDCFYDTKDFEDVIMTVAYILQENIGAEFWCTYQERSSDRSIEALLYKWKLTCRRIPLSAFDAESPSLAGSNLPGPHTIHMLIITNS